MGEVYRARDTRLERIVAVKILPPHLSSDPVRKQRFEREAKTISSLNHPHICTLYDVGQQDGVDFLVMECVEGETLSKRLEKGPLPLEQVLKFGAQIADALAKAHRAGIVHRDLKPSNIMLTSTGAKLLDFGLAKPTEPASGMTLTAAATHTTPVTQEGMVVGTFQYMSPEQIEGKELDGRSTIFSLGAVLYEMLTGQKAFQGKSQLSVASAILEKEPVSISSLKPLTPPAFDHVIRRCLAKDPEERWQTARDLALELKWVAEAGSQTGTGVSSSPKRQLSQGIAWGLAATCLLLVIALLATLLLRPAASLQPIRASLLPPPNSSFVPYNFAVSPDGRQLAFVALGPDGKTTLWVRALSGSGAQQLSGTDGATYPFWSPDSRQTGFFADGRLKTVDVANSAVQVLCDSSFAWGGSWNREGTIVFGPTLRGPLQRVSASGGTPTPVTKIMRQGSVQTDRWPFFLPDGKHFLYFADWSSSADPQGALFSDRVRLFRYGVTRLSLNAGCVVPVFSTGITRQTATPAFTAWLSGYRVLRLETAIRAVRQGYRLRTLGPEAQFVDGVLRIEGILLHPTRCGPASHGTARRTCPIIKKSETVDGFVATPSTRTGPGATGYQRFES
jgi:serine/threonine protein kinase